MSQWRGVPLDSRKNLQRRPFRVLGLWKSKSQIWSLQSIGEMSGRSILMENLPTLKAFDKMEMTVMAAMMKVMMGTMATGMYEIPREATMILIWMTGMAQLMEVLEALQMATWEALMGKQGQTSV